MPSLRRSLSVLLAAPVLVLGCSAYSESSAPGSINLAQFTAVAIPHVDDDKHRIGEELRAAFMRMRFSIVPEGARTRHIEAHWRYDENPLGRSKVWVDLFDSTSEQLVYSGEGGSGTEGSVGDDIRAAARLAVDGLAERLVTQSRSQAPEAVEAPGVTQFSSGSGVLLCNTGLVATNFHVIEGAASLRAAYADATEWVPSTVLRADPQNDIAILEAPGLRTRARGTVRFVTSDRLKDGEHVTAIGFPLVQQLGIQPRITDGIVSSKFGFGSDPRWLQISVPIQPGNSGGPLFDDSGNLAGLIVASANAAAFLQATGDVPQNVNFAIKSDYLISTLRSVPERHHSCLSSIDSQPGKRLNREQAIVEYRDRTILIIGVSQDGE